MSKELCQGIINYIQNKCHSHEELTTAAAEIVATHKGGLLTDEERDRIFAAGKAKRKQLNELPPDYGEV